MVSEQDIRQLLQRHGYELIKIKRYKTHDHIHFRNGPEWASISQIKVIAILKVHIEDLPVENAEKLMRPLEMEA